MSLTNRDNILRALRRQQPEKVGFDFVFSPALLDEFRRRTGREDYQEYYNFPLRCIELDPTNLTTDYTVFFDTLPPGTRPLDLHRCGSVCNTLRVAKTRPHRLAA